MFHTNYVDLQRYYHCDADCEMSGCPGHTLRIKINNTAGVGELLNDGKHIMTLGCNEAKVLYEMLDFLVKEG